MFAGPRLCYASGADMGNVFAIVAYALLWLFLAAFFYVVLRTLIARARSRDADDRWEHGL